MQPVQEGRTAIDHQDALTGSIDIDGTTYPDSIALSAESNFNFNQYQTVVYDLHRQATRFEAVVGQTDDSHAGVTIQYEISAGSRSVKSKQLSVGQHQKLSLDVSNQLRLQVRIITLRDTWEKGGFIALAGFGTPTLQVKDVSRFTPAA